MPITGTVMNPGLELGTARGGSLLLSSFENATQCLRQEMMAGWDCIDYTIGVKKLAKDFMESRHKGNA